MWFFSLCDHDFSITIKYFWGHFLIGWEIFFWTFRKIFQKKIILFWILITNQKKIFCSASLRHSKCLQERYLELKGGFIDLAWKFRIQSNHMEELWEKINDKTSFHLSWSWFRSKWIFCFCSPKGSGIEKWTYSSRENFWDRYLNPFKCILPGSGFVIKGKIPASKMGTSSIIIFTYIYWKDCLYLYPSFALKLPDQSPPNFVQTSTPTLNTCVTLST